MSWFDKLSRKIEGIAVSNITAYLVGICVISNLFLKDMYKYFAFDVYGIIHGEVWRIFSWIMVPSNLSTISVLFLVLLIPFGRAIEQIIGCAKLNAFYLCGFILSVCCGFLQYFVISVVDPSNAVSPFLTLYNILTTTFILMGLFMPNTVVQLYFIIPIKMKYMIAFYFIITIAELIEYLRMGNMVYMYYFGTPVIYALINVLLVFFSIKNGGPRNRNNKKNVFYNSAVPKKYEKYTVYHGTGGKIPRHKCAICGKTDIDSPDMTFRYCSQCNGNYEYCMDHLYSHEHIK